MADAAVEVPLAMETDKPVDVALDDKGGKTDGTTKVVTADEGIDDLKAQVARAKAESAARLNAADRQIADAFKQANEAQREVVAVKRDHVGTIIEKLTSDKEAAKRDLKAAHEAGDFDKVADAQDRISMANARIVEAEKGKLALDEEAKAPTGGRQVAQPVNDPVERLARAMQSQRAADWVRSHPDQVMPDGNLSPRAMAAHWAALDGGHPEGSDGYFSFIDSAVSGRAEPRQDRQQAQQGRDMNRAPTSAPVNRDVMQAPGAQRPGSMRLEPHEVQTAMDTYGPLYPKDSRDQILKRYATDKQALIDEGKIARRA